MRNVKITVAQLSNNNETGQHFESEESTMRVAEQTTHDKALMYVFGGAQGREEESMLSEEYTPQIVVQIDPSMTPDTRQTPTGKWTPQNGKSSFHAYASFTGTHSSIISPPDCDDHHQQVPHHFQLQDNRCQPSIIVEESPRAQQTTDGKV